MIDRTRILDSELILIRIAYTHSAAECLGRPCVIHNRGGHHMRNWTLHWRSDRGIFERICPHEIGHPDPDQFDYWRSINAMVEATHGCDFCCNSPEEVREP